QKLSRECEGAEKLLRPFDPAVKLEQRDALVRGVDAGEIRGFEREGGEAIGGDSSFAEVARVGKTSDERRDDRRRIAEHFLECGERGGRGRRGRGRGRGEQDLH